MSRDADILRTLFDIILILYIIHVKYSELTEARVSLQVIVILVRKKKCVYYVLHEPTSEGEGDTKPNRTNEQRTRWKNCIVSFPFEFQTHIYDRR